MKSCMDCKHAEETIFDDSKKCINEKSEYHQEMVDERNLCREWEDKTNEPR